MMASISTVIKEAFDLDDKSESLTVQSMSAHIDSNGSAKLHSIPSDLWSSFMLAPSEHHRVHKSAVSDGPSQYESELVGHAEACEEFGVAPGSPYVRVTAVLEDY